MSRDSLCTAQRTSPGYRDKWFIFSGAFLTGVQDPLKTETMIKQKTASWKGRMHCFTVL